MTDNIFTCVSCNVAFNDSELQRTHYKSDWHRYNLKRKIAELPSVTFQIFAERAQLQKKLESDAQNAGNDQLFCKLCSKHFTTANSFSNHKQSKKHQEVEASRLPRKSESIAEDQTNEPSTSSEQTKLAEDEVVVKSDRAEKKASQLLQLQQKLATEENEAEAEMEEDASWEDVEDDLDEEMDEYDESKGIPLLTCLFCDHVSDSLVNKCEHMAKEHSFFIHDTEHVSDMEGLIKFLGIKLGAYHVCLWCSSKCYQDLKSVQKHMNDKGHTKMKFEGETLYEYADFYSFGDDDEDDESFEMVNVSTYSKDNTNHINDGYEEEADMYELVLPSGAKVGHRSLFKYYKQSFGHRTLQLKQLQNVSIKDKYKAIASNGTYNQVEVKKQRKDMACLQRWKSKMQTKLGVEANSMQKHFRRQDICF